MAAKESRLGKLHELLAEHFIAALDAYELSMSSGKDPDTDMDLEETLMVGLSPALLGVMAKFLKDNEITCQVDEEGNDLEELRRKLEGRRQVGNVTHL